MIFSLLTLYKMIMNANKFLTNRAQGKIRPYALRFTPTYLSKKLSGFFLFSSSRFLNRS